MCGAILGIFARPLIEALMQLKRALREDPAGCCAGGSADAWTEPRGIRATAMDMLPCGGTVRGRWKSPSG